jgi:hypothetical protein
MAGLPNQRAKAPIRRTVENDARMPYAGLALEGQQRGMRQAPATGVHAQNKPIHRQQARRCRET